MASKFAATLRIPNMRYLFGAYVIDDTASWGYSVVLAAYAYERSGSTGWIAVIACTRWIVGLAVSGYAGVLADRYDRSRLIAVSGALCAVPMALLGVVVVSDGALWLLPALSAVDTALSSPVRAATGAMVPDIVPEADLLAENGLFALLENVVVVLGPGIGGLLLLAGTPATAIFLNAASYLVAAGLYLRVRTRSRGEAADQGESRLAQWSAGVRAIARTRATVLLTVFVGLSAGVYGAAVVVYAPLSVSFGTGPSGYSYLLASSALGSVAAAVVAERLSARTTLAPLLIGAIALEAVPFWISDFVSSPVVGAALQAVSGAGLVIVDVLAITALQRDLPRAVLGRALAAVGAVALAATVLGNLLASTLISTAGLSWTLGAIGIGFPVLALACLPVLSAGDRANVGRARELNATVELLGRLDLFDGAPRHVLERLAAGAEPRTVPAGEVLIRQGDDSDFLYLLSSGRLGVAADGVVLPVVCAPAYVGELGLLRNAKRSATVIALEPCAVLRIAAADFGAAVETAGRSASLIALSAERLARTSPRQRVGGAVQ